MLPYMITKQDNKIASPKETLAIEYKKAPEPDMQEERPPSPPEPPAPEPVKVEPPAPQPPPDLLVSIRISSVFFLFHTVIVIQHIW